MATLAPLLACLLLEAGLWAGGYGYRTSFLLPARIGHEDFLVQNDRFAWRFLGQDLAREPFPLALAKAKPANSVRIFVLGESAAFGDPQPEYGLPRMLQALLEGRYPGLRFEVVNAAMTAINSHAIVSIARDCAPCQGDVWVVYMGNNEVVGPFGAGTVFGRPAAKRALIRATLATKATRTGQLLERLLTKLQRPAPAQREWGGMKMFLRHQVRADDPYMAAVYSHFERNLVEILGLGRRSGAKLVVSTVAANLKDCAPFASLHRPGLPAADLAAWERLFQQGAQARQAGRLAEAVECFRQAARLDDTFAELHYQWGRCSMLLGRDSEALEHLTLARDQDALRFRADSRINEIIRRAASGREADGIRFIDAQEMLARQSSHGVVGNEFLHEHVHLNFEGNYALALAVAEQIARVLPAKVVGRASPAREWPSTRDCARRLGWTDWSRREGILAICGRVTDAPFTAQSNHAQEYERLRGELERLLPAVSPAGLEHAKLECEQSIKAAPEDWVLHKQVALLREKTGDFAGAAQSWRRVLEMLPRRAGTWFELGRCLAEQNREAEALEALRRGSRLAPGSVEALTAQAQLLARQAKYGEAIGVYERALGLKPYWSPAHLGLGKALEASGRGTEAQRHFRQALQDRVYTPEALQALARFCFERGWLGEAVTNFNDALLLHPADAATHVNLGVTLAMLGRRLEAQRHYAEALRLDPSLAEAHVRLGFELGRQGDDAGATEHFAAAVRLKPNFVEARLNLGIALRNRHREAEALAQFQEALRLDPTNDVAFKYVQSLEGKPR